MTILVTGAAGFIGAYVCQALGARNQQVVGIDNYAPYYDRAIKYDRLATLCPNVTVHRCDITDFAQLSRIFAAVAPTHVIHLAAQAGVRYSMENPHLYAQTNVVGFVNVLELCRHSPVTHLVYASSSSVYGDSATPPFNESQSIQQPRSLYAATKIANEAMAYSYTQLYGLRATGLRFFTVYGPWGRPDMAPVLFSRAILAGRPITVFNHGQQQRDFTHIHDITAGIIAALSAPADPHQRHRIFNLGNQTPVALEMFIQVIERAAGRSAIKHYQQAQPGDMEATMADTRLAHATFGFDPTITIDVGMPPVVSWCNTYFGTTV